MHDSISQSTLHSFLFQREYFYNIKNSPQKDSNTNIIKIRMFVMVKPNGVSKEEWGLQLPHKELLLDYTWVDMYMGLDLYLDKTETLSSTMGWDHNQLFFKDELVQA